MDTTAYKTYEERLQAWAEAALAKLRADGIDPNDDVAAQADLSNCCGDVWSALVEWRALQAKKTRLKR